MRWRRGIIAPRALQHDGRGKLEIEEREREALDDDSQPSPHQAESAAEHPTTKCECRSDGDVADIQPDVEPDEAIEGDRGSEIAKPDPAACPQRDHQVHDAPRRGLYSEVQQQAGLRLSGPHGSDRGGSPRDAD